MPRCPRWRSCESTAARVADLGGFDDGPRRIREETQSLAELLANCEGEGRPFTESDLLTVMPPILEGLACVHTAGVLLRDIKPSNILIQCDGRPVPIDFGAAKQAVAEHSWSLAPYTRRPDPFGQSQQHFAIRSYGIRISGGAGR